MEWLLIPIDVVCERRHAGLLAEPLNVLTSLAYAAVAVLFAWRWRPELHARHPLAWLLGLLLLIGLASFAAHTLALRLTHLLNGAFTGAFMALVFFMVGRYAFKLSVPMSLGLSGGLLVASALLGSVVGMLQAQQQLAYLPALALLVVAGAKVRGSARGPAHRLLWLGAVVFALALVLHAMDMPMCALTGGFGTHWLWHVLNDGLMVCLLLALHGLMKDGRNA